MSINRTIHKQNIGMPYTSYQQNAKALKIMFWRKTIKYFYITIIAGGSSEVEDP
jgi:hypothetical protein